MIQNESGGDDGRTMNRADRKCNQTWGKKNKNKIIAAQCQLREIVKTLCGRVYIMYFLPDRQFFEVHEKLFKEDLGGAMAIFDP